MTKPNHARALAADLLQINAIRLSPHVPFTWASGLKSPVYCDNRLLLSYPDCRNHAIEGLAALSRNFRPLDGIAGVATAGIPHGALLADRLQLPFCYVRSQPKNHGRGNQIEGLVSAGQRVLVVEDLISTGGSSLQAAKALEAAGASVVAVIALLSYGFTEARVRFEDAGIPLESVSDFPTVLDVARESGFISEEEFEMLTPWYRDPRAWSDRFTLTSSP